MLKRRRRRRRKRQLPQRISKKTSCSLVFKEYHLGWGNTHTKKMLALCLGLLLFVTAQGQTLPQCTWSCNNPTCDAVCVNKCLPANCTIMPMASCPQVSGPSCNVLCPPVNDTTQCPMCETSCASLPQTCITGGSTIVCEPVQCGFECLAPSNCPYPTCTLSCASPSCGPPAWGSYIAPSLALLVTIMSIFMVL